MILDVVETKSVVSFSSVASCTPVTGSSDSNTMRCFVPRSWMRSPRRTVTAPFPKPTAICERSWDAAKSDIYRLVSARTEASTVSLPPTGNCRRPLLMVRVLRQVGMLVFLTSLSRAHAFSTGSLLRSSFSESV